jgi:hypothetical protein
MKKIIAICTLALIAGYAEAQTTAGHWMIGGNVGYTSQKTQRIPGDTKTKSLNINPQVGYFVADNVVVGLEVGYTQEKTTMHDNGFGEVENKYSVTTLAPFARYYKFTSNEKFAFYAQASVGLGFTRLNYYYYGFTPRGRTYSAQLSPGFTYLFDKKWALDLQLRGIVYTSSDPNKSSDAKNDKTTSFTFNASSLNPALGFRYFIGK